MNNNNNFKNRNCFGSLRKGSEIKFKSSSKKDDSILLLSKTFSLIFYITFILATTFAQQIQQDNFQQQQQQQLNSFSQSSSSSSFPARQLPAQYGGGSEFAGGGGGGRHFRRERVSWCTTNLLEKKKCQDWAKAIEEVNIQFEGSEPFELNLDCVQGSDKDNCMSLIDDERADMILLDPGEIGVAGRYHSLTPIMMEKYSQSSSSIVNLFSQTNSNPSNGHYSVAIVKKRSANYIQSLSDLWGKRACFSGVSHMASWILPLASIIDLPRFEIADCNNLVKSASYFFGNSCAPNSLINKFNPTGDNPQKMSSLCEKQNIKVGAHYEPYQGAFSALKCLADPIISPIINSFNTYQQQQQQQFDLLRGADVAFLPHNTIFLAERLNLPKEIRLELPNRQDLELLCPQGGRQPLDRWQNCNFGFAPAHAIIVSSRISLDRRQKIQKFLKTSVQLFSSPSSSLTTTGNYQPTQTREEFLSRQQQQQTSFSFDVANSFDSNNNNNFIGKTLNTNFKLTGDYSFINYPSLDVLFSSDMIDLIPLNGVGQTFKGFLNSFPVQLATTATNLANNNQQSYFSTNNNNNNNRFSPSISSLFTSYQKPTLTFDNSIFTVKNQIDYFEKLRRCSVPAAVLCITSEKEFNKCLAMSKAFHAAGLKPEINCKLAQSTLSCMQLIKDRDADLVVLDAADIYLAGLKFNLIPIVSEQIEAYENSNYAVAVSKKSDQLTDLFTLKGKLSCHSGFLKAAGWIMPINFLLSMDRLRKYDNCDSAKSAAEHFDRSCAPGILSSISSTNNLNSTNNPNYQSQSSWTIRNMCELCHGSSNSYCARDSSEPFYGDSGSFRCLVEGGGQVAFCKHTAIFENTGGSNREKWARNLIKSDFELLCRDGSRAQVNDYKTCNLGIVPPNAIVTRGDTPFQLIEAYVNLFMYGQQYYGSKYTEEYTFKMFSSQNNNGKDLIFQDATQQLVRVPLANQTYKSYLNFEFLRAMETVFCN